MTDFAIVLWCWQGSHAGKIRYTPELVNFQAQALRRHVKRPYRLVVITDYPVDRFDPGIDVLPMWTDLRECGGCYSRLKAFDVSMRELIAPEFVWLDLDMVILADLDPLWDHGLDLKVWQSDSLERQRLNGSMVQMVAGAHSYVWERFDLFQTPNQARAAGCRGTDQAIMALMLPQDVAVWTYRDGVGYLGRSADPKTSRIVFSPGPEKVTDPAVQQQYPWLRGRVPALAA